MRQWRDTLAAHGRETELGEDLAVGYTIHIAETEEKAIREARGLSDDQIRAMEDPRRAREAGLPTLEDGVKAGSWLCGPPELVTEKLEAIQDMYPGLDQINVGSVIGTPQNVVLEQLEAFGKDVMPKFKAQAS